MFFTLDLHFVGDMIVVFVIISCLLESNYPHGRLFFPTLNASRCL
jgi:hypothetical protein